MTALQIAARPFTSPCALCCGDIPQDLNTAVFALADDERATVCDHCARALDPVAFGALSDLRVIDGWYWNARDRGGYRDPGAYDRASTWLGTLLQGLAALHAMYQDKDRARVVCRWLHQLTAECLADDEPGSAAVSAPAPQQAPRPEHRAA